MGYPSAISELANMIMGNTATILASRIGIEITPPSLMGEKISISPSNMRTICIPLTAGGDNLIDIDVSIEERR